MMTNYNDETQMFRLASRRYPQARAVLAVSYFCSDRRRAGLGALDERKRGLGRYAQTIHNFKYQEPAGGMIVYRCEIRQQLRQVIDQPWCWPAIDSMNAAATMTVTTLPGYTDTKCIPFNPQLFETQQGRTLVAKQLRRFRRDMREAKARGLVA